MLLRRYIATVTIQIPSLNYVATHMQFIYDTCVRTVYVKLYVTRCQQYLSIKGAVELIKVPLPLLLLGLVSLKPMYRNHI